MNRKRWLKRKQQKRAFKPGQKLKKRTVFPVRCYWCSKELTKETVTVDHLISRKNGGSSSRKNLVLSCYDCNQYRGKLQMMITSLHICENSIPFINDENRETIKLKEHRRWERIKCHFVPRDQLTIWSTNNVEHNEQGR